LDTLLWQLILQVILIALNAVFACAEIAVLSANDNKLNQMASQGNKKALRLQRLIDKPAKFLATIQVAITLSGFLGSAFAADNFSDILVDAIIASGVKADRDILDTVSVIAITLILSYFTLVFGELIPKRLAMKKADSIALGISNLVTFISKLFAPIVWLLTFSTNIVLRLFGVDPDADENEVSEEDIRSLVDEGNEQGVLDSEETEMIHNVFEFGNLAVKDFATHRTDIDLLQFEDDIAEWDRTIHETRHSIYPICSETVDNIIGILRTKDYFRLSDKTKESIMENAVRKPYFVPESITADVLFKQMKETRHHFAVALDEYGGVAGIVTMNDILEQIVGDFDDEKSVDEEPDEIAKLDENTWSILGSAPLSDVSEALGIELPTEDYDTFGGLVFASYGSIPDDGTTFEIAIPPLYVSVTKIFDHRIEGSVVRISETEPDEEKDEESDGRRSE